MFNLDRDLGWNACCSCTHLGRAAGFAKRCQQHLVIGVCKCISRCLKQGQKDYVSRQGDSAEEQHSIILQRPTHMYTIVGTSNDAAHPPLHAPGQSSAAGRAAYLTVSFVHGWSSIVSSVIAGLAFRQRYNEGTAQLGYCIDAQQRSCCLTMQLGPHFHRDTASHSNEYTLSGQLDMHAAALQGWERP